MLKLAVLASGRGTNLQAIARAIDGGRCNAKLVAVISDKANAPALEFATVYGAQTRSIRPSDFKTPEDWDCALANELKAIGPDLVVLAGFMRIVRAHVLKAFAGRIINVHPALLPSFAGKDAPAQAIAAGVKIAGCTVHIVDAGIDTGPILAQAAVPVVAGDTAETLHRRIQEAEHVLLPLTISRIADDRSATMTPAQTRDSERNPLFVF